MSFVERNKRWVLPVLGAALAGVVWLNLPASSTAEPGAVPRAGEEPGPKAPSAVPVPDLPLVEDNETLPLLLAGRQPLSGELRKVPAPPVLHPGQWGGLFEPPPPKAVSEARSIRAGKLPTVDFLLETPTRLEAWMGGKGYREGDALEGGYVLKRIGATGVVVSSPAGDVRIPLRSGPLKKKGTPP